MRDIETKLESYNGQLEQLNQIVEGYSIDCPEDILNSAHPKTGNLIFSMMFRIKDLSNGLMDTVYSYNNYASNVLCRSLIEHFITFSYVLEKYRVENTDEIGTHYYSMRQTKEEKDYIKSKIKQLRAINYNLDGIEELQTQANESRGLNDLSNRQLKEINDQFLVTEMVNYMVRDVDFENVDPESEAPIETHFISYLTHHSNMSSYIHGGPFAERMSIKYLDEDKLHVRLDNLASSSITFMSGAFSLGFLVLFTLTENRNYLKLSEQFNQKILESQ